MVREVVDLLRPHAGETVLDLTVGLGGHASALAAALGSGTLVGIDRDRDALTAARQRLAAACPAGVAVSLVHARMADAAHVLHALGIRRVDVMLADLGVSSLQLDLIARGLAHRFDAAPLDMRMDQSQGEPVAARIARTPVDELARVLHDFGEVRQARRIAAAVRDAAPQNAGALKAALAPYARGDARGKLATRVFQALRMWVNDELGELDALLETLPVLAAPGARIAILSYHSLEDRRVKNALRGWERGCVCPPEQPVCTCGRAPLGRAMSRRPVEPSAAELAANPRSRSARLRGFRFAGGVA